MLKEIVDSVKYTLNDVNYIAFKIPALGGVLGPLVVRSFMTPAISHAYSML